MPNCSMPTCDMPMHMHTAAGWWWLHHVKKKKKKRGRCTVNVVESGIAEAGGVEAGAVEAGVAVAGVAAWRPASMGASAAPMLFPVSPRSELGLCTRVKALSHAQRA